MFTPGSLLIFTSAERTEPEFPVEVATVVNQLLFNIISYLTPVCFEIIGHNRWHSTKKCGSSESCCDD